MYYDAIVRRALSKGLSEVEIYKIESRVLELRVSNDKIVEPSTRREIDIGLRGVVGKRIGALRVNRPTILDEDLDKLVSIVKVSQEDPYWHGFPPASKPLLYPKTYDEESVSKSEEEYAELLKYIMDRFKEPALSKGVESAIVVEGSMRVIDAKITITNSNGVDTGERYSVIAIWLTLNVNRGGDSSDKSLVFEKNTLEMKTIEKLAMVEGERALLFFGSKPIASGTYDVVFTPITAGEILSTVLAPAFSGLNILENRSPLRGRKNSQVFNERLTIIDDPSVDGATGSRSIDHEGVATYRKSVVDKGVFKTILHSYYTARRMNEAITGNALRMAPHMNPTPGFTNMVIEPGKRNLEQITQDVDKGIVVFELIGYWMSDFVTGSVKATATHGLYIERGEIVRPVKGIVIGGNIYEMLSSDLVEIGGDVEVVGNIVMPSMWIKNVRVAGE